METVSAIQSLRNRRDAITECDFMLACINCWTNSQVTIDYKRNDARVMLLWANTKFALATRGLTH